MLAQDEVRFALFERDFLLPCSIVLTADPKPRLSFQVEGLERTRTFLPQESIACTFTNSLVECEADVGGLRDKILTLFPILTPIEVSSSESIASLEFDLMNFPAFFETEVSTNCTRALPDDSLIVSASDWRLELRPAELTESARSFWNPEFRATHSCHAQRSDGQVFTSADARAFLNVLHDMLSFAAERWVAPIFVRGLNADGRVVWTEWGIRPVTRYGRKLGNWFDAHHAENLRQVIKLAFDYYKHTAHGQDFHETLYWYLRANSLDAGVDGGIILFQAALERLAWQRLVIDQNQFTESAFKGMTAETQLRWLLESCDIQLAIPLGLEKLQIAASAANWHDGPKTVTALRNQLVHPRKKRLVDPPFYEAWRLMGSYVELVLLRRLGFNGTYFDRTAKELWTGSVRPVPWMQAQIKRD